MKPSKPVITDEERELFRANIKGARPLTTDKVSLSEQKPKPKAIRKPKTRFTELQHTEVKAELEALSPEDPMYFMRPGLQIRIMRKLQRRDFPIETELDLHGLSIEQALAALDRFIADCIHCSHRCVKIIHGKGSSSKELYPVLKNKVNYWLRQYSNVLAFCSAKPTDGGTGAVYVLLKKEFPSPTAWERAG